MTLPPSLSKTRVVAIGVFFSFFVAACGGAAITEAATERAIEIEAQSTVAPATNAPSPDTPAADGSSTAPPDTTADPTGASTAAAPAAGDHQFGVSIADYTGESAQGSTNDQASPDATTIVWDQLIPSGAAPEEIFARFEERLEEAEIGSPEASAIYQEMQAEFNPEAVNPDLDGQKVWLAGFVAPLVYEDDVVTEFLLVPTFGACIHVPPPPPNQTILVSVASEDGLSLEDAWGAVWVEGTLVVTSTSTDLADTSYTMSNATLGVYNNF